MAGPLRVDYKAEVEVHPPPSDPTLRETPVGHALFEAWLDGQWVLFDPTGMAPIDRVVRIGTGRDAKDVAFATTFGQLQMTRKEVMVLEHDPRSRNVVTASEATAM